MTQRDCASRLPPALALLLLWVPGSLALSGPRTVTGTVGGSLSVQCPYEEEYTESIKYWCKSPCLLWRQNIVQTTESKREVTRDRVSIRDHPANLTFTVTLENLTEDDEGTYGCGIHVSLYPDPTFWVKVSVFPAPTSVTRSPTGSKTSTVSAHVPAVSTARPVTEATHSPNSQEDLPQDPGRGLLGLLSLLALLLLLLGGSSLLAWRMFRRRTKAGEKLEPLQNDGQAAKQNEVCYANLELQMRPHQRDPMQPKQVEVEYSTVGPPRNDVYYSSVVFSQQSLDPDKSPSQRPRQPGTEYSVVRT